MRAFGCMTRAVIQSAQMLAYPSVVSETASMGCLYGSLRVWQVSVTVLCGGIKLCGKTDEHAVAEKYETHQHARVYSRATRYTVLCKAVGRICVMCADCVFRPPSGRSIPGGLDHGSR